MVNACVNAGFGRNLVDDDDDDTDGGGLAKAHSINKGADVSH